MTDQHPPPATKGIVASRLIEFDAKTEMHAATLEWQDFEARHALAKVAVHVSKPYQHPSAMTRLHLVAIRPTGVSTASTFGDDDGLFGRARDDRSGLILEKLPRS